MAKSASWALRSTGHLATELFVARTGLLGQLAQAQHLHLQLMGAGLAL
jgi:hypothetical protein